MEFLHCSICEQNSFVPQVKICVNPICARHAYPLEMRVNTLSSMMTSCETCRQKTFHIGLRHCINPCHCSCQCMKCRDIKPKRKANIDTEFEICSACKMLSFISTFGVCVYPSCERNAPDSVLRINHYHAAAESNLKKFLDKCQVCENFTMHKNTGVCMYPKCDFICKCSCKCKKCIK